MQIIPVIDIRNGIAVRAVAGERNGYRAIQSRLTESVEPAEVMRAMQQSFPCAACYVADLDAIERQQINRCSIAEIVNMGVSLIVDAGATSVGQIEDLFAIGVDKVVLSSESIDDLSMLNTMVARFDRDSFVFSVDLRHGRLLGCDPAWDGKSPIDLARFVIECGIRELIVLDLAAVGTGLGIPTLQLCQNIRRLSPGVRMISGGGVDSAASVAEAAHAGLDGLLIASALHDGRLTFDDLAAYLDR